MHFKHFIITRFNTTLMSEPPHLDITGAEKRYDKEWFQERVRIFEQVCAPTIKAQTNKNFQWIIIFGEDTPIKWISDLHERHEFTPLVGSYWKLMEVIDNSLRRFAGDAGHIVTTNVDSDDGISKNYIEEVQRIVTALDRDHYLGIQCLRGMRWHIKTDTYVSVSSPSGPFPTMVEPIGKAPLRTVLSISHGLLHEYVSKVYLMEEHKAYWLMGIHDDNLANRMKMTKQDKPHPFAEVSDRFGL